MAQGKNSSHQCCWELGRRCIKAMWNFHRLDTNDLLLWWVAMGKFTILMVFTRKDGDVHGLLLVSGKVSDCQDASGAILWYHQTCSPACKTANRRPKKIPQFCYANKKWEGVGDGDACLPLKNISVLICLDPPFGCQISSKKVCFLVVLGGLNFRRLRRIQVWIRIYFNYMGMD